MHCSVFSERDQKQSMMKPASIGAAVVSAGAGIAALYFTKGKWGAQGKSWDLRVRDAMKDSSKLQFGTVVDAGFAVALENDVVLSDFVDRAMEYRAYDEDVFLAFAEAAGGAAEFLQRLDEIQYKRTIPARFRAFTSVMNIRLRELRRAVRDQNPSRLEEFDELVTEVKTYSADTHHNLWCDAHNS